MGLTQKTLEQMNKSELTKIAQTIGVDFDSEDNEEALVAKIHDSGKYNTVKESGKTNTTTNKQGERVHKDLGKYYRVRVFPTEANKQNTSIFISINMYAAEFQPGTIVELPAEVIRFLKAPRRPEHYYDANAVSENGNIGCHKTRYIPNYIVERVD